MFWSNSILFCGHAGSIEDRRYLRHEILNEDIEYNVIVTTWVNVYNDDVLWLKLVFLTNNHSWGLWTLTGEHSVD